jgi:hypothetical protein
MTITDATPVVALGQRPAAANAPTPWRRIVHLALLSTLTMAMVVLWDVNRTGAHPANLLQGATDGPAYALLHRDFPDVEFLPGLGLDGQQYYAMARNPVHLDQAARSLDRPIYRWQRPLFPWLARVVHPTGTGGAGLVGAFFILGLAALLVGGIAAGALSTALGGRTWPAALFPLLPGAYMSMRVTVSDSLAMALVLVALALSTHRRAWLAVAVGCLAALTRETTVIVFVGWALARRTRATTLLAVVPIAIAGAWAVWLRVTLPAARPEKVDELGLPFVGLLHAIREYWIAGADRLGMFSTIAALALAGVALVRAQRSHPLLPALALSLAFVSLMNRNVVGIDFGATRSTMPLMTLAMLCLATRQPRVEYSAPAHGEAGMVGPGLVSGAPAKR